MSTKLWIGLAVLLGACSAQRPQDAGDVTTTRKAASQAQPAASIARDGLPVCRRDQMGGHEPQPQEIAEHRRSPLPTIRYPFNTQLSDWGIDLTLRVDENGRVVCYSNLDRLGRSQALTTQRQEAIQSLQHAFYAPFSRHHRPVAALVDEHIDEEELPERHLPLPSVPLHRVRITLERTACFGSCPVYRVEINGDGRVVYDGERYVDVEGRRTWRIPTADVARLVESLRTKDLWSLREAYVAQITDNPTRTLTLQLDGQEHRIVDYVGRSVGMPRAVSDFQQEIDRVSGASGLVDLSYDGVRRLEAEGFRFDSPAGAALLERAIANRDISDNRGLLRVIELGAPLTSPDKLMEAALEFQRSELLDPLIERGALTTGGQLDPAKLDAAFRAAIAGGRLTIVQKIWDAAGWQVRPSLTFDDVAEVGSGRRVQKRASVAVLLSHQSWQKTPWDGMEIAQWLARQGGDLKTPAANGNTLLHVAAEQGDGDFVRYLLQQGLDPSARGAYGLTPLGSASNEEVALLILEAGGDPAHMNDRPGELRHYAEQKHWGRVVAWLKARGM